MLCNYTTPTCKLQRGNGKQFVKKKFCNSKKTGALVYNWIGEC